MTNVNSNISKITYAYVLVHSMCAHGQDYLDCYWPFAAKVLSLDGDADLKAIKYRIKATYSLDIPHYSLISILNRARKEGYLDHNRKLYVLKKKGIEYIDKLESEEEVERRLSELIYDISQFLSQTSDQTKEPTQIRSALFDLIDKNIEPLLEFFNAGKNNEAHKFYNNLTDFQKILSTYLETAEERKPACYQTLKDIFFGSLISNVINSEKTSKIDELRHSKFKNCEIYFDTNVVLSVLKLHDKESNISANDLLQILTDEGFVIKVFNFTVDEICGVLQGYASSMHRYPDDIEIDSIYSILKRQKWTTLRVRGLITDIEDILEKLNIKIDWSPKINLSKYEPQNDQERQRIRQYKPAQELISQNHDLAAIDTIIEYNDHAVRKIENAKAIFLTSDKHLSRYNFEVMGHKKNGTVCEVISANLLSNILWLKNPTSDVSLRSFISIYSTNLLINKNIWEHFYERLRTLRVEKEITDSDIEALFYHHYIEGTLKEIDESEIEGIDDTFIHDHIKKAREKSGEIIDKKEQDFIQQLQEAVDIAEIQKEEKWIKYIQDLKITLRTRSDRSANRWSSTTAGIVTLLILGVLYLLNSYAQTFFSTQITWLFIIIFGGGVLWTIWRKLKNSIRHMIFNRIYRKKLKEIGFDNIPS